MENGNPISGVLYRDKDLSWGQTKTEYAVGQPQKRCKIGAPVLRDDTDFRIRNLETLIFGDAHVKQETQTLPGLSAWAGWLGATLGPFYATR